MVAATIGIAGASWMVWLHHYFLMGSGPNVNTLFSVSSMIVGIPTGIKVFNWVGTMWRGKVRFESSMLWATMAVLLLIGGGMTGMMVAFPPINYVTHNTVFVVAHFHNMFMLIAFAIFGGFIYWWPKMFGFKLNETLGKWFFWLFWAGTVFVFVPMYILGFFGMMRRQVYLAHPSWEPLLLAQTFGIALYIASVLVFLDMLYVSIRDRDANRVGADAWGTSRSLEWRRIRRHHSTTSRSSRSSTGETSGRGAATTAWTASPSITMSPSTCRNVRPSRGSSAYLPSCSALP
jgi:cytochrome o ubiquinol oxidase subunit 1